MPKTGSSAIQAALAGLDDDDVRYIETGRWGTAHHLVPWNMKDPADARVMGAGLAGESMGESLTRELANTRAGRAVLSSEALFHAHWTGLAQLRSWAEAAGWAVEAKLYIRDPATYVDSWYRQIVKLGTYTLTMGEHLEARKLASYAARVEQLDRAFDLVDVRPYARNLLVGGDSVSDFADWISVPGLPDTHPVGDPVNASLDHELVEFKRVMNGLIEPGSGPVLGRGLARLSLDRQLPRRLLMTERQVAGVRATMGANFDQLARRFDIDPSAILSGDVVGHEAVRLAADHIEKLYTEVIEREPDLQHHLPPLSDALAAVDKV